jgi:hypothetical protein
MILHADDLTALNEDRMLLRRFLVDLVIFKQHQPAPAEMLGMP